MCEILREIWQRRHEGRRLNRQQLETQLESLQQQRGKLVAAFVYQDLIDEQTYRREGQRLDGEERKVLGAIAGEEEPELPVDRILSIAQELLQDPAAAWKSADPEERLRLQWLMFPDGVQYNGEAFGTAVTSPVFGWLRSLEQGEEGMVTPRGFEPLSPG